MSTLVEFPMSGGPALIVATSRDLSDVDRQVFRGGGGTRDVLERSTESMQTAIARLKPAAQSFVEAFTDLPRPPDELSVTFGVELSAELGAIIASTAAKANFSVTITWKATAVDKPEEG